MLHRPMLIWNVPSIEVIDGLKVKNFLRYLYHVLLELSENFILGFDRREAKRGVLFHGARTRASVSDARL